MSSRATGEGSVSEQSWVRGLWSFYRAYTDSAIHAAAAAALTAFGLLIFVDPLFALLAIASYVVPPVVLYALRADTTASRRAAASPAGNTGVDRAPEGGADLVGGIRDVESDSDTGGTDTDTDSDTGGTDTDTDSDTGGTDTDTDSDG